MSLTFEFILEDARWQAQELAAIGAKLGDVIPQHLPLPAQCTAVVMANICRFRRNAPRL